MTPRAVIEPTGVVISERKNAARRAAQGEELVRSTRPHQGVHNDVRGQSVLSAEKVK